ncbi:4-hydroxythreonine-4-phosphate dehydrogenase PdxA [Candidatus Halocynthiibacter alkanivorans]|uniref:4-hydroxythreonine-4-phosphate dehydrogenase PdxA n=1 Tax=Candidatus Halocynthiibacter alkanivorans TaxID=2267619 RepID=UPI000DF2A3C5|nr:4-hydroxythreonine-4-phosphate dehydrogenase PdxA [Candidatus Halocynthiibacter alkanivorans]
MKPRIGIIPGDPSGIGPELIARLLASEGVAEAADILLIGDAHIFERGQQLAGVQHELIPVDARQGSWSVSGGFAWHETRTITRDAVVKAEATRASGASVLATLDLALDLARDGVIDAVVFAPFNKAALHLAGMEHSDELHYMADRLGVVDYLSELNTLDGLWTSRVTSHIALRDVADAISEERITEAVALIDKTLRRSGLARPRISVAALNPHAGDGGNFGREEIDVIEPAVRRLAGGQMAVDGPWPSDTVFLKAVAGEIDGIVTMYHDQGQIALKLLGFDRGVTVQGGMPFPVTTPAHGTAFDIAGLGKADVGATLAAFQLACDMVENWRDA